MRLYSRKKGTKFLRILLPAYIKAMFRPAPVWVHLYVTRKCNLKCSYCFVVEPGRKELNTEDMKKVIDHLHYLGTRCISFFGGEPTIRRDLLELIEYANKKRILTHITTNGSFLTQDYIDKLGKADLDVINLSVDSVFEFNESKKDYTRCREVLSHLLEARKKYGFEINVNLVLTAKNVDITIQTLRLINSFNVPMSIGLIAGNTYNNLPVDGSLYFFKKDDKEKLLKVCDEIKQLKKQGFNIIEPEQYFEDIKKFVNHELKDWYCSAGEYYFSIDCDGKFQLCAGSKTQDISIFDVDRDYYKKFKELRETSFKSCKKICLANCLYDTSFFIKRPAYFFKEILR